MLHDRRPTGTGDRANLQDRPGEISQHSEGVDQEVRYVTHGFRREVFLPVDLEDILANLRDFLDFPRRGPDKVAQVCETDLNETWYSVKEMDSEAWHVTW